VWRSAPGETEEDLAGTAAAKARGRSRENTAAKIPQKETQEAGN